MSQVLCLLVLRMGKLRHRGWILVQGCWSLSSIEIGWGLCDPEAHFSNNNIPSLFLVHIYFSFPGHIFLNLAQVLEVSDCYFGDYVLNCHVSKHPSTTSILFHFCPLGPHWPFFELWLQYSSVSTGQFPLAQNYLTGSQDSQIMQDFKASIYLHKSP